MNQRRYDALLIDLDGTLLQIDLKKFIPAYIETLAKYFAKHFQPEKLARDLLAATQATIKNNEPALTNETVFYNDFCRRLGVDRAAIDPLIKKFYRDEFPRLRSWSRPRPHAAAVLGAAQRRGLKMVLATQPIFPHSAIIERLAWGGLDPACFDLITTLENMHFCKPHLEYYLEIARKIDLPPERCLMAGNNVQEDLCAAKVGLGVFLVEGEVINCGQEPLPAVVQGTLKDLAAYIEKEL
ncbi:MAG: HAD family hydrolase [Dethiobacteria bacterium]|jgi:FMN phosphatase YigB (HAD superfamily)|nr:HAD family hydrolase [Bacillota bacterium]HOB29241.1 HAD family hydrolase [Bacillota bacterium]HPZ41853.1 HAD family hydrolase [Bacillota bacterium]HQD52707.1 HAD family hydrolase [Bacillota bacterium]